MARHARTHACTHTVFQLCEFSPGKPGEPIPEETFTHSHLSWSSIITYLLHPSITIHSIRPVQFLCLTVFPQSLSNNSLVYLLALHPPLHTPYFSSLNHCLLFTAHAHTIATRFATHPSDHNHLCPLKCHIIFLSYV